MTPDPGERLRSSFAAILRRGAAADAALTEFAAAIEATRCLPPEPGTGGFMPDGAQPHLETLLDGPGSDGALADAIRAFAPTVDWYRILDGAAVDPVLEAGMLVGRPELPPDAPVRLGLFLIAPGVHYPLHQHAAHEIYYVASGRIGIQNGLTGACVTVGPGEYSVTPCHCVHSLTTGDEPCLIFYVWTGEITAPAWWWAEDERGWHRTRWERADDGRWSRQATEPVTAAVLAEAGEPAAAGG